MKTRLLPVALWLGLALPAFGQDEGEVPEGPEGFEGVEEEAGPVEWERFGVMVRRPALSTSGTVLGLEGWHTRSKWVMFGAEYQYLSQNPRDAIADDPFVALTGTTSSGHQVMGVVRYNFERNSTYAFHASFGAGLRKMTARYSIDERLGTGGANGKTETLSLVDEVKIGTTWRNDAWVFTVDWVGYTWSMWGKTTGSSKDTEGAASDDVEEYADVVSRQVAEETRRPSWQLLTVGIGYRWGERP